MRTLSEYIYDFETSTGAKKKNKKGTTPYTQDELEARHSFADFLKESTEKYDAGKVEDPTRKLAEFVLLYNSIGQNKERYKIQDNILRNITGVILQDFLIQVMSHICKIYPRLDIFTEVPVPFGRYPLWKAGNLSYARPSELSDIAVGYLIESQPKEEDRFVINENWPKKAISSLKKNQFIIPVVTVNSKIRVSQSEFFDWLGREQLMTKGNPHCLSVQVALRAEMKPEFIDAAQARPKFFLLGSGNEGSVTPFPDELARFVTVVSEHLKERMEEQALDVAISKQKGKGKGKETIDQVEETEGIVPEETVVEDATSDEEVDE